MARQISMAIPSMTGALDVNDVHRPRWCCACWGSSLRVGRELLPRQQEFREGVGDVRREWAEAKVWAAWQLSGESRPLQGL